MICSVRSISTETIIKESCNKQTFFITFCALGSAKGKDINMKKILRSIILLFIAIILNCSFSNAEHKSYISGNFKYQYESIGYGVCIVKITPLSNKGIKKLVIPETLGGEKVVRIGDNEEVEDSSRNVFGVWDSPEGTGLEPAGLVNKVDKIKTIVLPKSLESMGEGCFMHMSTGKSINIPATFVVNVEELADHNMTWKKVTSSPKNPKYSVVNGCLLSKNRKKLYAILTNDSKVVIPNKVKQIDQTITLNDATKKLYIPKSVTKIEKYALASTVPVQVSISKKNKNYGVKKGSIYSKRSGRLVLGYINHGVLDIPNTVTNMPEASVVGTVVKKIILPKSLKKIANFSFSVMPKNLTVVCKRKVPPVLLEGSLDTTFNYPKKIKFIVPKGSKSSYQKKWKAGVNTLMKEVLYIETDS